MTPLLSLPWPLLWTALALSLVGLGAGLARIRQPSPILLRATATPAPYRPPPVCLKCGAWHEDEFGARGHTCDRSATIRPLTRERLPPDFGGTSP